MTNLIPFRGVSIRKDVQGGDPCIACTKIRTRHVYILFMAGVSIEDLQTAFERSLSSDEVEQALRYEMRVNHAPRKLRDQAIDLAG
jgi:uncharacterized protein (DUF433 family)